MENELKPNQQGLLFAWIEGVYRLLIELPAIFFIYQFGKLLTWVGF